MSRTRVLFAAAAITLLGAACSSTQTVNSGGSTTSGPTDTTFGGSTTSTVAGTATSVVESTVPPTPPPTVAPTLAPPAGGSVLSAPTNLQSTAGGGITLPSTFTCTGEDPGIPGWSVVDCQQMPTFQDGVTTLVLRRSDDGRFGVVALFRSGGSLVQRFRAEEPEPGVWSSVVVQLGDYHFDDGAEVWVGYRYEGTGQYFDLDVLDARPDGSIFLGGLQGLDHGVVDLHPGGATVQSAAYGPSDPGCCPSNVLQREITFSGEQWWINVGSNSPTASAPAVTGDF